MLTSSGRAKGAAYGLALLLTVCSGRSASALDQSIVEAAKKEGSVVWYTTQIVNQLAVPVAQAFLKKYGVKVSYVRANASETALRVSNEAAAGRVQVDVFDGTTTSAALEKINQVLAWTPDSAQHYPKEYVDPKGFWVATNLYVLTSAYNTDLVKAGEQPKTWDDLLEPRWRGKMVWGSTDSASAAPGFIGLVLKEKGDQAGRAYLQKLAGQQIAEIGGAARQVLDQTISGEYSLGLQIFNDQAALSASQGAPIKWAPLAPASTAVLSVASIAKGAPHPNAAKLFLDFLVSREGQQIYRDAFYIPADPDILPKDASLRPSAFRVVFLTPEEAAEKMPVWGKLFSTLFR